MSLCILIDYQNLHHHVKHQVADGTSTADVAAALLDAVREREGGHRPSFGRAYADFSGLDDHTRHVKRTLYLHGVEPVYVPATMHRNTTDLQLAVDAMALTMQRPDIETVVLLTGDRDYVPVVHALVGQGKRVVLVGFREHLSPHVLRTTGRGEYVDATALLPEGALSGARQDDEPVEATVFADATEIPSDEAYDALVITLRFFGQYREVYLTPLLRRLSDELPADADPKGLVAELEEAGAAKLERRRGMPYDYTVLLLNDEHPEVAEARAEVGAPDITGQQGDDLPFDDEPDADGAEAAPADTTDDA